jgi:hypothetical protein
MKKRLWQCTRPPTRRRSSPPKPWSNILRLRSSSCRSPPEPNFASLLELTFSRRQQRIHQGEWKLWPDDLTRPPCAEPHLPKLSRQKRQQEPKRYQRPAPSSKRVATCRGATVSVPRRCRGAAYCRLDRGQCVSARDNRRGNHRQGLSEPGTNLAAIARRELEHFDSDAMRKRGRSSCRARGQTSRQHTRGLSPMLYPSRDFRRLLQRNILAEKTHL